MDSGHEIKVVLSDGGKVRLRVAVAITQYEHASIEVAAPDLATARVVAMKACATLRALVMRATAPVDETS